MGLDIASFFENKAILITGATGFLGKDTSDSTECEEAVHLGKSYKHKFSWEEGPRGDHQQKLIQSSKREENINLTLESIVVVAGDVSCENLGISDTQLKMEMWEEIDIIVNSAATTRFDERYDVAQLAINTFGAMNLMSFAHKCANLKMFLHVSTAYTCGERVGAVLEKPFRMGETLNGFNNLDINKEQRKDASEKEISNALKNLGIQRFENLFIRENDTRSLICLSILASEF